MIAPAARAAIATLLGPRIAFDAPLARHTSLGVGGPADALALPQDLEELAALVALAAEHGVPLHVLGGGFNTLVLDGGVDGIVVRTQRLRALTLEADAVTLRAEAGVSHSQVVRLCAEQGLSGLEFGAGVPGTVGGWITMNAGVPDAETGAVVREVEIAGPGAERCVRSRAEMDFGYRTARGLAAGAVVLAARFTLRSGDRARVRAEIDRHLAHRRTTQPVDQPSFGSVFKNPPGAHAGALIERAGLKGLQVGGAQISPRHANFIVNRGGATAADVLALIARAQAVVSAATGIVLEPEVRIVGRPAAAGPTEEQRAVSTEEQRAVSTEEQRALRCR
ncbi:MAG: UDP-N-acetylmuramate dehydrogenase [Myxococcota bacterium]|nr:UDP-N-acetylmuramate dehydrogenase [Myxococcota bacterium]